MLDEIRQAGGQVFGISSEPQSLATEAEEVGDSVPVVGDPHHEIREACSEQAGWMFYNEDSGHYANANGHHPKVLPMAVVAVHKTGRVLCRWRCAQASNMNGAGARPEAAYVWKKIQASLQDTRTQPLIPIR